MQAAEQSYYRGALSLLRFVEQRAGSRRRFGAEADATWRQFKGELSTADRIQLLLADAHAQWPGAVGASNVCLLPGVAKDDAFGPDWEPLSGVEAETVWREAMNASPPASLADSVAAIAAAWGLALSSHAVGNVTPSSKVVVSGPSAVAALIQVFAANTDLDWARQVVAVATPPSHRQLAAAAGVLLNLTVTVPLTTKDSPLVKVPGARAIISEDADPLDAQFAAQIAS
jgi:hypothetical protein